MTKSACTKRHISRRRALIVRQKMVGIALIILTVITHKLTSSTDCGWMLVTLGFAYILLTEKRVIFK